MFVFTLISLVIFVIVAVAWSSKDWLNVFIKLVFVCMALYALALLWPTIISVVNQQ